jgi:hypothetical protein
MNRILKILVPIVLLLPACFSQDPMPILNSSWERTVLKAQDPQIPPSGPAKALTANDKVFQRQARELRTDILRTQDEPTIDERSAALEKAVQESRTPKSENVVGYSYTASVRNDSEQTVKVVFWEYRFIEIAHPTNVVRRQFLCAVDLKQGKKIDLSVFSLLGPSDTIDAESLAKSTDKLFEEKVQINRIELSDDSILQRNGWKYDDVRAAIKHATSTPWGKEICRAL